MVLNSIEYFPCRLDCTLVYEVEEVLQQMDGYFYKFCGKEADEARAKVLLHTLTHYKSEKGDLKPYIKSLIRDILKDGGKLVCVDFLEETVSEDDSDTEGSKFQNLTRVPNFVDKLIADNDDVVFDLVSKLVLTSLRDFLLLSQSLISGSINVFGFSRPFIENCLKITKEHPRFNEVCVKVYDLYKDDINYFLSCEEMGYLYEADFTKSVYSQQVAIVDRYTGFKLPDPDRLPDDELLIKGKLGDRVIYRIDYLDILENIEAMYSDTKASFLRLTIGNYYIARNLSGQVIYGNPSIQSLLSVAKHELLSTLQKFSLGRLLVAGSEHFYMLCPRLEDTVLEATIADTSFKLVFEEVDLCEV